MDGAHPRLRRGAERLRPPLHLLHHPLRPRQFALGADGRGRRADPPAGRERLSRGRADRRRHHRLWRRPARHADASASWSAPSSATCRSCRACASPRSTRSRSTTTLMRAIAEEERLMPHLHLSLQHGDDMILKRMKRRHSRADAIRFADDGAPAAARRRLRRRPHRRLPDRDRGDVRATRCRSSRNAG